MDIFNLAMLSIAFVSILFDSFSSGRKTDLEKLNQIQISVISTINSKYQKSWVLWEPFLAILFHLILWFCKIPCVSEKIYRASGINTLDHTQIPGRFGYITNSEIHRTLILKFCCVLVFPCLSWIDFDFLLATSHGLLRTMCVLPS